ncbi:MAG: hypothetical protein ACJAYE_001140 [Candidatus Azotimanducaceae bacterium]|jgi:uncharacterized protein YjlB
MSQGMTSEQALQVFNPATIADDIDEMHPATEELLQVLEGKIEVEVLPITEGGGQKVMLGAADCFIVPGDCWHRQMIHLRSKEFYLTPGEALHSHAEDPRAE